MTLQLTKRRFTVDEYHQMATAGILTEDDRVELIDGEIIQMTTIVRRHAASVRRLNHLFSLVFGDSALVDVQNPVFLDVYNEPQPDVVLLAPKSDYYASGHPRFGDILLLIEVADSSLELDRDVKLPLYARGGIREVWLVDLEGDAVIVCREPSPVGYQTSWTARRGDWISPAAFPGREISVSEVLG